MKCRVRYSEFCRMLSHFMKIVSLMFSRNVELFLCGWLFFADFQTFVSSMFWQNHLPKANSLNCCSIISQEQSKRETSVTHSRTCLVASYRILQIACTTISVQLKIFQPIIITKKETTSGNKDNIYVTRFLTAGAVLVWTIPSSICILFTISILFCCFD